VNDAIPSPLSTFWFLRHGESESNVKRVVAGWTDVPLTARGRTQAAEAAERLRGKDIGSIYCSHLIRARDTAAIVAERLDLAIEIIPELAERNWGALEGQPPERRDYLETPPGGESAIDFVRRTLAGLAKATAATRDAPPLIVAHSGTFRVIRERLLTGDKALAVTNCQPIRLDPPADAGSLWRATALTDAACP
jgi:probable phosphoglycerate mutase